MSRELPDIVVRALRTSLAEGFVDTTRTETGWLLATLAAAVSGPVAECGTGCGVGAAWLRWGAPPATGVFTAEANAHLADRARTVFATDDITVVHGDWAELAEHGPFGLLCTDHALARDDEADRLRELLRPGGIAVIDALAPRSLAPYDPVRNRWLEDAGLIATEVPVSADSWLIVATRTPAIAN